MPQVEIWKWQEVQKRWIGKINGKVKSISPRQLGFKTRSEAIGAANKWIKEQQAAATLQSVDTKQDALDELNADELRKELNKNTSQREALQFLITAKEFPEAGTFTEANVEAAREKLTAPVAKDRTIGEQLNQWKAVLKQTLKFPTYKGYETRIETFAKWIDTSADISILNAAKLQEFFLFLHGKVKSGELSPATAKGVLMTTRQFIRQLAELDLIGLPGNIQNRKHAFGDVAKVIPGFKISEVKELLNGATERTKLFLLLMLNCGMYQGDIANLKQTEVNWTKGTITRKRSKRADHKDAQTITYTLWKDTFDLLKQFRSSDPVLVLLNERGKPLVNLTEASGRWDSIREAYKTLCESVVHIEKPLKVLRKTSAQLLDKSPYKDCTEHFLAHAPNTVTARSYVPPDQGRFDEALKWLHEQIMK